MLVGMAPIGLRDTAEGSVVAALLNVDWGTTLPAFRQMLFPWLASIQEAAISGACVGTLLGIVWGAFRR
jgi:hypothetical protein